MKMQEKSLDKISQNIESVQLWTDKFEDKKEKLQLIPVKASHICLCEVAGITVGIAMMGTHMLDLGALTIAGIGGAVIGTLIPYIVRQIKIGDLNYQIFMNNLIIKDLKKQKKEVREKVKIINK